MYYDLNIIHYSFIIFIYIKYLKNNNIEILQITFDKIPREITIYFFNE